MKRRFLCEDAQARFDEARFEAVRRIGEIAAAEDCELVVVCGDVFESNAVDRRSVARALEALSHCPVPVYLLPGNHDPLDGASVYRSRGFLEGAPSQVHVLDDARPRRVRPGLELVGMPWASKRPGRDLVAETCAALEPARGVVRIGIAHGCVDALSPDRDDPARIALAAAEAALADGRLHFLALGDRHSRTRVGETDRIHYAGAPEPTDWNEVAPGFVNVVDVDERSVEVDARPVARWRFERRRGVPLSSPADLEAFEAWLAALPEKGRCILRLDFEGSLDLRGLAQLEAILERARDVFACVDVWEPDNRLAVLPDAGDFDGLGLAGFAARAVDGLRERAGGHGDDALAARDALALLVRLAAGSGGAG
jgi:DNA repair exonuclease SbcCD nuclease subunit